MISKQSFCIVAILSAAVYAIGDENSFLQVKLDSPEINLELTQGKKLYIITKSDKKVDDVRAVIKDVLDESGVELDKKPLKLDEIQGEAWEIATREARDAVKAAGAPVLVDVKSIEFTALNGLPGPYFGTFHDKVGSQGLVDMLSGFSDKTAVAKTVFVYLKSEESDPLVFEGAVEGRIVPPANVKGFKWEDIFAPLGHEETLSQLEEKQRNESSTFNLDLDQFRPFNLGLNQFRAYIIEHPDWI
jgi:inosine triphosphate pyrophosphatase